MLSPTSQEDFVAGYLDLKEEQIDVLDLEKAIAAGARNEEQAIPAAEALS
jgi:hypothetical protein